MQYRTLDRLRIKPRFARCFRHSFLTMLSLVLLAFCSRFARVFLFLGFPRVRRPSGPNLPTFLYSVFLLDASLAALCSPGTPPWEPLVESACDSAPSGAISDAAVGSAEPALLPGRSEAMPESMRSNAGITAKQCRKQRSALGDQWEEAAQLQRPKRSDGRKSGLPE